MSIYQYIPLDPSKNEVRFLTLYPGSFNDDIHIGLESKEFTSLVKPKFEALYATSLALQIDQYLVDD
jgi:hypothetical protein